MIKKFINIFLFISINTLVFSYSIQDYLLFQSGKENYLQGNYPLAQLEFSAFENNFKNSSPLTSNYAYYYMGMNYFKSKDYNKAIFYLTKAIYIPKNYYLNYNRKSSFFQYRRDYYLGKSYLALDKVPQGIQQFKNLVLNYYSPDLEEYEKKSLEIISKYEPYYNYILEAKYENNLHNIDKLSFDDLKSLGSFFLSKRDYLNSFIIYKKLYTQYPNKNDIRYKYILSLLGNKQYLTVIHETENINDISEQNLYFLRGKAFENLRNFPEAINNFSKVKYGFYKDNALEEKINLLYILGKYSEIINILSQKKEKTFDEDILYLNSYIYLKNKKKFLQLSEKFIEKYPYTVESGAYSLIRNNIFKNIPNPWNISEINSFYLINMIVNNYISTLEKYNLNIAGETLDETLKGLNKISSLGDEQLIILALNNADIGIVNNNINNLVIKSSIFANGGFYDLALKNAHNSKTIFYQYSNLIHFLFPKYYLKQIEDLCKKYDLPENLVYTIILSGSEYNPDYVSPTYKIGLMGLSKDSSNTFEDLINPNINLELGIQKLAKIYSKNNNNNLRTLIEYSQGTDALNSLFFEKDGDIDLNKIKDSSLRKNIQNLMYNFAFYNALYN